MANQPYNNFLDAAAGTGHRFDWDTDDFLFVALSNAYTFNATHGTRSDLTGVLGMSSVSGAAVISPGIGDCNDVTDIYLGVGDTIERVVLCRDTGTAATDTLLLYWDRNENGTPIHRAGDGGVAPILMSSGPARVFRFGL